MRLHSYEIVPGIVAYLEPCLLSDNDVVGPAGIDLKSIAKHPFACLDSSDDISVWALFTTKPGNGRRVEIPEKSKIGHAGWLARRTYARDSSWVIYGPNYAIVEASECEYSMPSARNYIDEEFLALLRSHCDMPKPSTIRLLREQLVMRLGPPGSAGQRSA